MTLDERAEKLLTDFDAISLELIKSGTDDDTRLKQAIRRALIEQDNISRHACAESVMAVDFTERYNRYDTRNACHSAVMNCREGVK